MDCEAVSLSPSFSDAEWHIGLRTGGFGETFCVPARRDPTHSYYHHDQPCQRPRRGTQIRLLQQSHYLNGDVSEDDGVSRDAARGEICEDLLVPSVNTVARVPSKMRRSMFVVGYALTAKKSRSFIQTSLLSHVRRRGINFVRIDCNRSLEEQGPFDVILHKMVGESWHRQLNAYMRIYPEALILDPIEAIAKVFNRESMLQEAAAINFCHPQGKVMVPKQLVVDGDPASISLKVANASLKFPLVIKAKWIDGTPKSHALRLAFSDTRLAQLTTPLVLQEFVHHGGVLFKVYVIGHVIKVVRRFSLPDNVGDVSEKNDILSFPRVSCAAASADGVNFDSNVGGELPEFLSEDFKVALYGLISPVWAELPPMAMLESLSKELRARLVIIVISYDLQTTKQNDLTEGTFPFLVSLQGLTLFNLDIIRERGKENHYYVVDINYFPGFGKVPGYEEAFTEFLSNLAGKM